MGAPPTFVFAGGGTGGHLFPGIAVAEELRRRNPSTRIVFVGSTRAIELSIVAEHRLEHRMLTVEPLPQLRRNPLRFAFRNWQAWRGAIRLLKELRPTAVIGLGGFASAPLVWAASRHRIPVVLLEQNVIPGRTTRWLSRFADQVCVSFAETRPRLARARSVIVTGNPVRAEIAALHDRQPAERTHPPMLAGTTFSRHRRRARVPGSTTPVTARPTSLRLRPHRAFPEGHSGCTSPRDGPPRIAS